MGSCDIGENQLAPSVSPYAGYYVCPPESGQRIISTASLEEPIDGQAVSGSFGSFGGTLPRNHKPRRREPIDDAPGKNRFAGPAINARGKPGTLRSSPPRHCIVATGWHDMKKRFGCMLRVLRAFIGAHVRYCASRSIPFIRSLGAREADRGEKFGSTTRNNEFFALRQCADTVIYRRSRWAIGVRQHGLAGTYMSRSARTMVGCIRCDNARKDRTHMGQLCSARRLHRDFSAAHRSVRSILSCI